MAGKRAVTLLGYHTLTHTDDSLTVVCPRSAVTSSNKLPMALYLTIERLKIGSESLVDKNADK